MSNSTSTAPTNYNSTQNCTSVSLQCPVEATVYGYYPDLGANAFLCAYFGIFSIVNLLLAFRYKTWVFGSVVTIGCLGEMLGYIGRILLHSNPWSNAGFEIQICTLILSPAFFAAAIYLTLKHMIRAIGPHFSPLRASLYPWVFITCDLITLIVQAIGGALAATANTPSGSALGGHIMLAGIVFQVATFTLLYCLTGTFIFNLQRNKASIAQESWKVLRSRDFRIFASGIFVASLAVYVRCVYRIAELATGWANPIMRNEDEFIVFDGVMCCIAVLALTLCYPGLFFKSMIPKGKLQEKGSGDDSSEGVVV